MCSVVISTVRQAYKEMNRDADMRVLDVRERRHNDPDQSLDRKHIDVH